MSAPDDKIDDLYRLPLAEFTAARNALAKSLSGDAAKRVKALAKPNVVPWAVNQVYWRARGVYDRLVKAGERLRKAQIAALEGKSTDVRAANDAHRHAIADAVAEAERLSATAGSKPSPDALTRTFEALSLASEPPEAHGRFTQALQPAGFEALAGVSPAPHAGGASHARPQAPVLRDAKTGDAGRAAPHRATREDTRAREREAKRAREEAEAARKAEEARRHHDAELRKADAAVARAEAHEKLARETWERAHDTLLEARKDREAVKKRVAETAKR